jgi:hypothetical protein
VAALNERGRGTRRGSTRPALQEAVEAILTRYRVQGLLAVRYTDGGKVKAFEPATKRA